MGMIVDFVKYREKAVPNQRDGLYVGAQPPFVIIEAGKTASSERSTG